MAYTGNSIVDYLSSTGQASDFTSRTALAQKQGIQNYTGTAEQNLSLLSKLRTPASVAAPVAPQAITASNLQAPTQPLNVPQYQAPAIPDPTASAKVIQDLIKQYQAPSPDEQAIETQGNDINSEIQRIIETQGTKSARQGELEVSAGIPELQKNLNAITAQMNSIDSSAFAATQNSEDRLAPSFAILGEQAQIARQQSVRKFGLAAAASVLTGNIALAQDNVSRAIDAEFSPLESKLNHQLKLLDDNKDKLSAAEKKRADVMTLQLQAAKEEAATQKANKETIYGIATSAAQNGAPNSVVNAIMNSGDLGTALGYGTGYLQTNTAASIQEYNFAVKNGYKGSFSQYQNEDANRKAAVAAAGVVTPGAPTSYKEWELAGKPGTYAQWLKDNNIKAPTTAQQTVATYAARIEQANPTIDNLSSAIVSMNPAKFEVQSRLPSYLQSSEFQQFDQAARNFINAVLRRESGAVISTSEFDNAYRQYLPRPGDTNGTLVEKKKNRDIVYASLREASGNAYQSIDDLLGTSGNTATPQGVRITRNGQEGYISSLLEFNPKTDKLLQ